MIENTRRELDDREQELLGGSYLNILQVGTRAEPHSCEDALSCVFQKYSETTDKTFLALLHCFVAHIISLKQICLPQRALPTPILNIKLTRKILDVVYPAVFHDLEKIVGDVSSLDLDGRVFASIVHLLCQTPGMTLAEIVGEDVASTTTSLLGVAWPQNVFVHYPSPASDQISTQDDRVESLTVLPFHNVVFDEELRVVRVRVASTEPSQVDQGYNYFDYGDGVAVTDEKHWHGSRPIVTRLQGGNAQGSFDAWQKKKQLKRQQREMARMQRHAMTLTGALGVPLQPSIIVTSHDHAQKRKSLAVNGGPSVCDSTILF